MSNVMDYLSWRGDLALSLSPLNEVDSYLFTQIGYLNLEGIVPLCGEISLRSCMEKYAALHDVRKEKPGVLFSPQLAQMLRQMAETERFCGVTLHGYVNHVDQARAVQFSALTIGLPDGTRYVSFRGTDDTLVAWKEDFMLSVEEAVPAQQEALAYLTHEMMRTPGNVIVGGHSKGGNLAVYAAMHVPKDLQERICAVYNFDGPGFRESPFEKPEYLRIRPKLHTIVPQHTIVGTLLCNETEMEIVSSVKAGPLAHDGLNWEVLGTRFIRCEGLSIMARSFAAAMDEIERLMCYDERRELIDALFSSLESTGAVTLTDLTAKSVREAVRAALPLIKNARMRAFLHELVNRMIRAALSDEIVRERLQRLRRKEREDE